MRSKRSTLTATRRFSAVAILPGAQAATAANYGKFFVADRICTVTRISESHEVLGTDLGAVTLSVERLQGVEASGAGDDLLGGVKVDLKGANNTNQSPALTGVAANLTLAVGDRLNLLDTGVLTAVGGVTVTVELTEDAPMVRAKTAMYDTRRILVPIHLPDTIAGVAANYGVIFNCPGAARYIFVGVEEIHTVAAGAAATLTLEKLIDGQAPGAGVALLAAALDLQGVAETPQYGSIVGITGAARTLGAGDRICLVDAGNPAAVRNCQVTIELEELLPIRAKQSPTENERVIVTAVLYGAQPQTAAMMDKFFTASKPCRIIAAREVHTTPVGGVCTLQIERLQGTEAPGTGDNLLVGAGFDLNGGAETVQDGVLTATLADRILAIGDRLALDETGALLAAVTGLCVTVELEAIQ